MIVPNLPYSFRWVENIRESLLEHPFVFLLGNVMLVLPCALATIREGHFGNLTVNMTASIAPFLVFYLLYRKPGIYELLCSLVSGVSSVLSLLGFAILYGAAFVLVIIDPAYCVYVWIPMLAASPLYAFYVLERRRGLV